MVKRETATTRLSFGTQPRPLFIIEIEPCYDWENLSIPFKDFGEYKNLTGNVYEKTVKPFVVTLPKKGLISPIS